MDLIPPFSETRMDATKRNEMAVIECAYCRAKLGVTQDKKPPKVAVCTAAGCQADYLRELAKCYQETKIVKLRKPKQAAKQVDWTAPEGAWLKDVWSGSMLVKIYMNRIGPDAVAYKCRLYRKLPSHYAKSLSDTIGEADLADAMRALYRAQRFIRERRRGPAVWRVLFDWLP